MAEDDNKDDAATRLEEERARAEELRARAVAAENARKEHERRIVRQMGPSRTGGGESNMEERVKALEDKVGQMREDIASIKSTLQQVATKADLHELGMKLIMWAVATMIAATAATSAIVFGIVRQAGPPTINVTVPPQVSAPATPQPARQKP
jgi:hypothetical protein